MKLLSWNVNGLRACARKGFLDWLGECGAEFVALQEVRARPEQLEAHVREPDGWHTVFTPAERPGYSGVALYSRRPPDEVETSLGEQGFDVEGRLQIVRFGRLKIINGYFPNGSGKNRDLSRIPYKLAFYARLHALLEAEKESSGRLLVVGDFNTAHQPIDLARPKDNVKTSGFRPEEREALDHWLQSGWVDTFRHFVSEPGHYSWWSQRRGVRERNVGWRIDYVLASPAAFSFVDSAHMCPDVMGSDHCPVGVELNPDILS